MKLVRAKNGVRDVPDPEAKLAHELYGAYEIDLERAFARTMDDIEGRLS